MKSIIKQEPYHCYLCDLEGDYIKHSYLERHHIYFGRANRKLSEKHGLKVDLCMKHHRGNMNGSREAVHCNRKNDLKLKRIAQEEFEKSHTREEFRAIFGKSWL